MKTDQVNIIKAGELLAAQVIAVGWPTWEGWKLLLFQGPYHGGEALRQTSTVHEGPWEAQSQRPVKGGDKGI